MEFDNTSNPKPATDINTEVKNAAKSTKLSIVFDIAYNALLFLFFFSHLRFSSWKYAIVSFGLLKQSLRLSISDIFRLLSRQHLKIDP